MHFKKITFSKHSSMDLTTGNLFFKFGLLALPLALTTMLQLLYTTIDLWCVSNFGGGSLSMSAVGSNTSLINLIVTVFVNMSMGANVAISHAKGAGDKEYANKVLHTSILIALFAGILVGLTGFFCSSFLLKLMGTPDSIIENATLYLKIYFVGLPFLMIYNYGAQMMRALGDSTIPLLILIFSGIFNVAFDVILVKYCGLDVAGVGIATVISQVVASILVILYLMFNKKGFVKFRFQDLRIDKRALGNVIKIGLPAGIQGLAFCIPNVMIQSSLYTITNYSINGIKISMDEIVSAGSACNQIESYAFAIEEAIGVSLCSFIGQNYGAQKKENLRKLLLYAIIYNVITAALVDLLVFTCSDGLLSIFINDSAGVIKSNALLAGNERLKIMLIPYIFDGIMVTCGNYLRGMKISTPPAVVTLIGCTGFRIIFIFCLFNVVPYFHTIFWLYAAYPISWILIDIAYIPIILVLEKKAFRKLDEEIRLTKLAKERIEKKEDLNKIDLIEKEVVSPIDNIKEENIDTNNQNK